MVVVNAIRGERVYLDTNIFIYAIEGYLDFDFSRYLENLSLNLSPKRRETLNFPPSRVGKGVRGLGFSWALRSFWEMKKRVFIG